MARFEVTIEVNAPLPQVWEAFMNTDNMPHWMDGFQSIENLSGNPEEVGSRWRMVFLEGGREVALEETVTAIKERQEFSFRIDHDSMWSETTIEFLTDGTSTNLVSRTEAAGKGILGKAMMGLMSGHMKKRQSADFTRFKAMVEEGRSRSATV
jgi:uncharacterized membrane protein